MLEWEKLRLLEYIRETALPEFRAGNESYGNILQHVFLKFQEERELQVEIAAAYEEMLKRISAKRLIRLSEVYRNCYGEWYIENDVSDWYLTRPDRKDYPHLTDAQYYAVLKFGTFLENGYDRQWCMETLDGAAGALPFFFLRLNDWVGAIRKSAFHLAQKRLSQCGMEEFFFALPMLEKVIASGRRDEGHIKQIAAQVKERSLKIFKEMPDALFDGRVPYYGVNVKNAIYRLISKNKLLSLSQMERLLAAEWTGYGKKLLLDGIFSQYGYERARLERYLASRNALVRYQALLFRYENERTAWMGLEKMLLDRAKKIRGYTSFILQKHTNIQILDYYLGELRREVSAAALLGIGEHGTKREIGVIEPFLTLENNQMAKAALISYGRLAAEKGESVYWKFLFDDRPAITKLAYRLIRKNKIYYGAGNLYKLFCEHRQTEIGKYLFLLLLCEPSWERLPYLLLLYAEGELSQEERWRAWDGINNRFNYAVVSERQAEKILEALERGGEKFPEKLRKEILFDLKHMTRK